MTVAGRMLHPGIRECSGIVGSRQFAGVYWVHNDSGNLAQLFAIDVQGNLLREVKVVGASNIDWEDITTDDAGNLYIGDFGNNRNDRHNLEVLVIREPDPRQGAGEVLEVGVERRIPFYFPEQQQFPNVSNMNFDCESIFFLDGALYVFTKHRSDTNTVLYRLPAGSETAAVRLASFDAGSRVTAASITSDGKYLAVLTYEYLHLFELPGGEAQMLSGPHHRVLIEARQSEAVCFDADMIVVTNEQREIYRIDRHDLPEVLLPTTPHIERQLVEDAAPAAIDWESLEAVALEAEAIEGRPPQGTPPVLKLTSSSEALFLQVQWRHAGRRLPGQHTRLSIFVGTALHREALVADESDAAFEVLLTDSGWQLKHAGGCSPAVGEEALSNISSGPPDQLAVRIPLASKLRSNPDPLRVNVIVRQPAAEGFGEWAWGATRSTRPWDNVLLWGRMDRLGGR